MAKSKKHRSIHATRRARRVKVLSRRVPLDTGPFEVIAIPATPEVNETQQNILQEAQKLTGGDRGRDYGHPLDNHGTTGAMMTEFLRRKYPSHKIPKLNAEDVCYFNILQKVSREANAPKRDNVVDIAGYARNVEMVRDEVKLRSIKEPF